MGASVQPSASGRPPKTRGWRTRLRVSVPAEMGMAVDVGKVALSVTGAPETAGKTSHGEGGPEVTARPSGRDPLVGPRHAGGRDRPDGAGRDRLEDVGRQDLGAVRAARCRLEQDLGRG